MGSLGHWTLPLQARFRALFTEEVVPLRMTLNNFDKSLNYTYSKYSPLQGLRAPGVRCICGSVFIILSDIRKLN